MPIKYEEVDTSEYKQANKSWLPGNVYVIDYGDGVTFKIGYTTVDPEVRIKQIARGSVIMPMHLVMSVHTDTNAFFLENILQMTLDTDHVNGEWFKLDFPKLVEIYQCMSFFGGVQLYDRWYELVPEDHQKMIDYYVISNNFPRFKRVNRSQEAAEIETLFGEIHGN
jgi:hypothetical protein